MGRAGSVDAIAERTGLDRAEVARRLEEAIGFAAARAWGPERTFEARFVDAVGAVEIHQVLRVVAGAPQPRTEVALESVADLGFEEGDEMLVQVFYRDEDAAAAHLASDASPALPPIEQLADGLPLPEGPAWLRELWPARRLVWRWGRRAELPAFDDALDRLERWLRSVAPEPLLATLAAPRADELERLRALGPRARDLTRFHERFGGAAASLDVFAAGFVTPSRARTPPRFARP